MVLDSTGSIFKLGDATVIGREDASLQIDFDGYPDGKYISHRHAQIVRMNAQYYIEDLGSSNHTWVNDIKLASGQSEPLKDGDKIRFGKIELTFHE
jgi:pSer/pThr/pTyr-binding forkhead associated (FHA) protein